MTQILFTGRILVANKYWDMNYAYKNKVYASDHPSLIQSLKLSSLLSLSELDGGINCREKVNKVCFEKMKIR